jgi:hypothetical protein
MVGEHPSISTKKVSIDLIATGEWRGRGCASIAERVFCRTMLRAKIAAKGE